MDNNSWYIKSWKNDVSELLNNRLIMHYFEKYE